MEIKIEKMQISHVRKIAELEKICFSEPWSEKSLAEEIDNRDAYFIVLMEDGVLAGYAGMHISYGECYVDNIAVFPEKRGLGYGERLSSSLIEKAEIFGEFITLEVREGNIPAVKLYEKLGFRKVGLRKNFYRNPSENALIMTKTFSNEK